MAQPQEQQATAPRPNTKAHSVDANQLGIQACRADDAVIMEQAISLASQPGSRFTPEKIVTDGLRRAAKRNALRVVKHLLDRGADVNNLDAGGLLTVETCKPLSRELLDLVAAYGWNVNPKTGPRGTDHPLLWFVVEDIDLVKWCLDHGAQVDVPDPSATVQPDGTIRYSNRPMPTILGKAASRGTVETFELLRSKGAPLDRRTLHLAVEHENIEMMRHLLEVVGLDVNADGRDGTSMYHSCSTAICITAFRRGSNWRFRPLVSWLLNHGADPDLSFGGWNSAMQCAEMSGNTNFLQVVEEWRARKQGAETPA